MVSNGHRHPRIHPTWTLRTPLGIDNQESGSCIRRVLCCVGRTHNLSMIDVAETVEAILSFVYGSIHRVRTAGTGITIDEELQVRNPH